MFTYHGLSPSRTADGLFLRALCGYACANILTISPSRARDMERNAILSTVSTAITWPSGSKQWLVSVV